MRFLRGQPAFKGAFMYGFDSFEGLPEEADGHGKQLDFRKGHFNSGDIRESLLKELGGPELVTFVKGFFNESLTSGLARGLRPAAYIDVDVDLFISTKQLLMWIFENQLAAPGTIIGYDDWWLNACSRGGDRESPLDSGEGKAHAEIAEEFGVAVKDNDAAASQANQRCKWETEQRTLT